MPQLLLLFLLLLLLHIIKNAPSFFIIFLFEASKFTRMFISRNFFRFPDVFATFFLVFIP